MRLDKLADCFYNFYAPLKSCGKFIFVPYPTKAPRMEDMNDQLTNGLFFAVPYDELEELNASARDKRDTVPLEEQESEYRSYLEKEKRIRAVTLCFSDLEGRFHMLD